MESRKWTFRKKRHKAIIRVTVLFSLILIYLGTWLSLQSLPSTYAWFNASSSSSGQITNATTSDLIKVIPASPIFTQDGHVNFDIEIMNISGTAIPLMVEVLINNEAWDISSTNLKAKRTYSKKEHISINQLENKNIKYRIVGFKGYIDVTYLVPLDNVKLTMMKKNMDLQLIPNKGDSMNKVK